MFSQQSFYSGMVPGVTTGVYRADEAAIDLNALCDWAGWRFVERRAMALDADKQLVLCEGKQA